MTDEEIWKDVPGYEGAYAVSSKGAVRSFKRGVKSLKPWRRSTYLLVDLWSDGVRDVRSVHTLVYEAFKGCVKQGCVVHHINGNKFDNSVSNLEQLTISEHNRKHFEGKASWNKGLKTPPQVLKRAWCTRFIKLKQRNEQVRLLAKDGTSVKDLSRMFCLSTRQVQDILKRRTKC